MEDFQNIRERLKRAIDTDIADQKTWADNCRALEKKRLGQDRPKIKMEPYKGAPNFSVPLIDDMVNRKTSQEISMLFNAKYLCNFIPTTPGAVMHCERAAYGFDWLLRSKLKVRQKLETIIDTKNCIGMGISKLVANDKVLGGCPDFISVSPYDVIVPSETESYREPERICQVIRLTERELRDRGRVKCWRNVDKILVKQSNGDGNAYDNEGAPRIDVGTSSSPKDGRYYVFWEIYHWRKLSETPQIFDYQDNPDEDEDYAGAVRWLTIMSPDHPELEIFDRELEEDVPWPFVQYRNEGRSTKWYDVRGVSQLLVDEQILCTAAKNSKAIALDYYGKPMFKSNNCNAGNIRVAPGANIGDAEPVAMITIPMQFDYEIDRAYGYAQQRVGAYGQGLSSPNAQKAGEAKTATEIQSAEGISNMFNANSVAAFNEPLAEQFAMMWRALAVDKKAFMFPKDGQVMGFTPEIFDSEYDLIPAGTSQTANPSRYYQQLVSLTSILAGFPNVRMDKIPGVLINALNPQLEALLVQGIDEGAPILQQFQQNQMVTQEIGNAVQQMGQDVAQTKELIEALKQAVMKLATASDQTAKKLDKVSDENKDMKMVESVKQMFEEYAGRRQL